MAGGDVDVVVLGVVGNTRSTSGQFTRQERDQIMQHLLALNREMQAAGAVTTSKVGGLERCRQQGPSPPAR
jgi:hypothetical protein